MFRDDGSPRTDAQNRQLAGWLALVAGFVNSAGFVLIGSFTSHVTGNVGRMANDFALGDYPAGISAALLVFAYLLGATVASMAEESDAWPRPLLYGGLLLVEASLLTAFIGVSWKLDHGPRIHDANAALLCLAMGVQNSFVTRLSGAVVRTTHLTGAVTDLGIEAARWFRYWRGERMSFGRNLPERPAAAKTWLLLTLCAAFIVGAALGAVATTRVGAPALVFPLALLAVGAAYAIGANYLVIRRDDRS